MHTSWRTSTGWVLSLPVLLLVLQLLGGRAATLALSGTQPLGLGTLLGLIYVVVWFACWVVVPPWLAALVALRLAAWRLAVARSHDGSESTRAGGSALG